MDGDPNPDRAPTTPDNEAPPLRTNDYSNGHVRTCIGANGRVRTTRGAHIY